MAEETLGVTKELFDEIRGYPGSNDTERLKNWKADRENMPDTLDTPDEIKQYLRQLGILPEQIRQMAREEAEEVVEEARTAY